jgi:Spy/CpxP family protein refolding chaperone
MTNLKQLLAAGLLSAVVVLAQGHGPRDGGAPLDPATAVQRRVEFLTKMLTLTDTQAAAATKIFTEEAAAVQTASANVESDRTALAEAVKKNDVASIDRLAAELGAIHGKVIAIHGKADAAFYVLLTPEQQTKFDTLRHGGMGGSAGPAGTTAGRMQSRRWGA